MVKNCSNSELIPNFKKCEFRYNDSINMIERNGLALKLLCKQDSHKVVKYKIRIYWYVKYYKNKFLLWISKFKEIIFKNLMFDLINIKQKYLSFF